VSIDVAMSARRLGADHVELVCLEQLNEMPAHEWERQDALEEGVVFNNGWGPKRILGKKGRIAKVEFMRCMSVFDDQGRFNPSYDPTTTLMRDADWMILAIGQTVDLSFLDGDKAFRQELGGPLYVDSETLESSIPGIFAGGDAVKMPGSVVDAVASGKRAAVAIHMSLNRGLYKKSLSEVSLGGGPSFSIEALFRERTDWDPRTLVRFADLDPLYLEPRFPVIPPRLTPVERITGFQEINLSLSHEEGIREAGRCFFCGTCIGCDLCLLLCPDVCIAPPHEEHDNYWPDPDYCKGCGVCAAVCVRGVVDMSEGT
jgi:ferredoxin